MSNRISTSGPPTLDADESDSLNESQPLSKISFSYNQMSNRISTSEPPTLDALDESDSSNGSLPKTRPSQKYYLRLANELSNKFTGPMPVQEFLDTFLPVDDSAFKPDASVESVRRGLYVTVRGHADLLEAVSHCLSDGFTIKSTKPNTKSRKASKPGDPPGFVLYHSHDPSLPELVVYVLQGNKTPDPFNDSSSSSSSFENTEHEETSYILGQLIAPIIPQFASPHPDKSRTHAFSVLIHGPGTGIGETRKARLIRWDRSGAVVSQAFEFVPKADSSSDGESLALWRFFWRYMRAGAAERGFDTTVEKVEETDLETRRACEALSLGNVSTNTPVSLYKYHVWDDFHPEDDPVFYYAVDKPLSTNSLVGRNTRIIKVWDPRLERVVLLKDTWRIDEPGMTKEGDTYIQLHKAQVRHVPRLQRAGDVSLESGQQRTRTQDFVHFNNHSTTSYTMQAYRHYRLVLLDIGRSITEFSDMKHLVEILRAALIAGILHCDISTGNIVISDNLDSPAFLIDWDLSKPVDQIDTPYRQTLGTWRFKSAVLLSRKSTNHLPIDDLESFFYVLSWLALHYSKHKDDSILHRLKASYDELWVVGSINQGGILKPSFMLLGTLEREGGFPKGPLRKLIVSLERTFKIRYLQYPSASEVEKYEKVAESITGEDDRRFFGAVDILLGLRRLKSSEWMMARFDEAVGSEWSRNAVVKVVKQSVNEIAERFLLRLECCRGM